MKKMNLKLRGTVLFAGVSKDEKTKNVVTIKMEEDKLKKLIDLMGDTTSYKHTPIKTNEKTGEIYVKTSSCYDVDIYEPNKIGNPEISEIDITEIGVDSDVTLAIALTEGEYRKQKHLVAYLKGILVNNFVSYEKYNAFEEDNEEL